MRGQNITDVLRSNRIFVTTTIRRNGRISRAEISRQTGLNKATVTNIVSGLIGDGIVRESGLIPGESGRRSICLELDTDRYTVIGLWVTRRHLRVGLFNLKGDCRHREKIDIGLNSPVDELIDMICEKIMTLKKSCRRSRVLGVALAMPGPYIKQEGRVALLTERHEWQNIDVVSQIRERTGLKVVSEHDANAFTIAEWCFSENYNDKASICCILIGQGVGGGIIEDGKLVHGLHGVAGEIGHMSINYNGPPCDCGNRGCLEKYCSSIALLKKVEARIEEFPGTVCRPGMKESELTDAYLAGDPLAREVLNEGARYLGYGIANIVKIFNPEKVIIGDEISRAGEDFLSIVRETVRERVAADIYSSVEIKASTTSDPVLRGACMSFVNELARHPEDFDLYPRRTTNY